MKKILITSILVFQLIFLSIAFGFILPSSLLGLKAPKTTDNLYISTSSLSNATVISDIYGWNNGNSQFPSLAVDTNGTIHVVWHDDTNGEWGADREIMYANKTGSGWSNATVISDDSTLWNNGDSYNPSLAVDANGTIHVVWDDYTNGAWGTDREIMYVNNTGSGWSNATVISDDNTLWNNDGSYEPILVVDTNGDIHVVWYDETDGEWGSDVEIMYANNTGSDWSNATVISDDSTLWNNDESFEASLAVDTNINIHVTWADNTNGEWGTDREIMYAKNTGSGWSNATVISDDSTLWNNGDSYNPSLAVDPNGNIHIAWDDDTNGKWGTDPEIMYAKNTGSGWSNAKVISDDSTLWNNGSSFEPSLAVDANGTIHIAWHDTTNGEWGTDREIMYAKWPISSGEQHGLEILLLLGMQQPSSNMLIFGIIGIGIAMAIVITIIVIKKKE